MDSKRLPGVVFATALTFGVLAKLWRAGDMFLEARAADGFWWMPVGIGTELLVAAVFALVVAAVGRVSLYLSGVVIGVGFSAELFWLAFNDVSFRISQIGITYARLRGDDGARVKDFNLMAAGDVYPAVFYAVVALVLGVFVGARVYRRAAVSVRVLVAVAVVGAAVWGVDFFVLSKRNFGMGESPVLLIARTWVESFFGKEAVVLPEGVKVAAPTTQAERLAMLTPQEPQPPSTLPKKKAEHVDNGILFFSEGIARKQTSLETLLPGNDGSDTTPHLLEALNRGGLEFENYYSVYHKSIAAIFAMTCSDFPPPNARNIVEVNPRIDCGALSEVLSKNKIHVGLFHGGDFGFYDKLQLLGDRGFEIQKDARAIAGNGIWDDSWGVDDRAVVDTVLRWIDTLPKGERFFAVIIPITAHYPYSVPPDVKPAFPGTDAKDRFYTAVHFLDEAFDRLEVGLQARNLTQETAVIYMADHGETVAERPRASAGRRLAYEPSLHVPMAIVAPKLFDGWQKTQRIGSHVDIVPTVLDLLGLPQDPRHHGRSLLTEEFQPRRIFIGANNGPKYVGFLDGKQKFIVDRSSGHQELYDLTSDPFEQHNLAEQNQAKVDRLTAEAFAFADGQLDHLRNAPKVSGDINTQLGLLEFAVVSVVKADGTRVVCPRDPADATTAADATAGLDTDLNKLPWRRVCPGFTQQPFLGQKLFRPGRVRTCVLVNVPEGGGALEITLGPQRWLPFLTRIRSGVDRKELDDDDAGVLTVFGDGKQGHERQVGKESGGARVTFPSSTEQVVVRLTGEHPWKSPLCLTFTETAWWNTKTKAAAEDAEVRNDDVHGAVPAEKD